MNNEPTKPIPAILSLLILGGIVWYFFGGGLERQTEADLGRIHQSVADDSVREYEIAKRSGSAMDAYVRAGLVAESYLQAKDEANYKKWKQIEATEATRAGMPSVE